VGVAELALNGVAIKQRTIKNKIKNKNKMNYRWASQSWP